MKAQAILLISMVAACGCKTATDPNDYLRKVSDKLSRIKSVSYYATEIVSIPQDSTTFKKPRESYYKVVMNPLDTLVGSRSVWFLAGDTTKAMAFYDGNAHGYVEWDKKLVEIDSFKTQHAPFRLVYYPFYAKINEIIKYALSTKDSIRTGFVDYGDSSRFTLQIIDKHVYFHLKPIVVRDEYIPNDEISQFDIWFRKSDDMPYKMRSKWYHSTYFEICHGEKINTTEDVSFDAKIFYPASFKTKEHGTGPKTTKADLTGKKAPDWTLADTDQKNFRLADFKSKVLLVLFTGIGCGPCHQSYPFLKKLVSDYKSKDFEFVSIETWSSDAEVMKKYQEKNGFNFKFLKATDEVTKSYNVVGVPAFFVIDKNGVIRKVLEGYTKEKTDKEIVESIDKLL